MNGIIYIIIILIVIGLRIIYQYGDLELLLFILKPVASITETFLGIEFQYISGKVGFINKNLEIQITKECSGVNFLTITILMLIFSFIHRIRNKKYKLLISCYFLIASYIVTILANASRIIGTIFIMNTGLFTDIKMERLMHQSIGVLVYFIYLILVYFIGDRITKRMGDKNESTI